MRITGAYELVRHVDVDVCRCGCAPECRGAVGEIVMRYHIRE